MGGKSGGGATLSGVSCQLSGLASLMTTVCFPTGGNGSVSRGRSDRPSDLDRQMDVGVQAWRQHMHETWRIRRYIRSGSVEMES